MGLPDVKGFFGGIFPCYFAALPDIDSRWPEEDDGGILETKPGP